MSNAFSGLLILLLAVSTTFAQEDLRLKAGDLYPRVFEAMQSDSAAVTFALTTEASPPIYFPEDVQRQFGQAIYCLHFSRLKEKIVAVPDGTGRVYEFRSAEGKLIAERLDQTTFTGYNFSAFAFTFRDTLYSLGGYGFWKYNGLLRHYDPVTKGWDVSPTNMEFPISGDPGYMGQWLNPATAGLYYIARQLPMAVIKNYKRPPGLVHDSTRIYRLNLNTKDWLLLGRISPEAIPHLNNAGKVAELPFGELIVSGEVGERKIMLLDYDRNRLMVLSDSLARPLIKRIFTGATNKFTWYSGGILHVGPSLPDTVYRVVMDAASFKDLHISIYQPLTSKPAQIESAWMPPVWLFVGAILGVIIGRSVYRKKDKLPEALPDISLPIQSIFNSFEVNILRGFLKHNLTLLPEEMNVLLETENKSIDLQKKYRSEAIRGINGKCGKLLGTDQRLILQERLTDDRRQFIYRLNAETLESLRTRTSGL